MPLVDPLDPNTDPETWELASFFNETLGFCPNSVLTMQRRPAISKAFIELNKAVMANEGRVTSALKRMIAWVSSNAAGCRYCQAHAIRAAERYGAEGEKLDNLGMLFDFNEIKASVKNWIDEEIDHTMLLYKKDPIIEHEWGEDFNDDGDQNDFIQEAAIGEDTNGDGEPDELYRTTTTAAKNETTKPSAIACVSSGDRIDQFL